MMMAKFVFDIFCVCKSCFCYEKCILIIINNNNNLSLYVAYLIKLDSLLPFAL